MLINTVKLTFDAMAAAARDLSARVVGERARIDLERDLLLDNNRRFGGLRKQMRGWAAEGTAETISRPIITGITPAIPRD